MLDIIVSLDGSYSSYDWPGVGVVGVPHAPLCTTCSVFSWPHVTTAQSAGPLTLRDGAQPTSPPSHCQRERQCCPANYLRALWWSLKCHSALSAFICIFTLHFSIHSHNRHLRAYLSSPRLGHLTLPWSMNQKIGPRILHLLFIPLTVYWPRVVYNLK